MKWDMPMRPIENGPLTDREIGELDAFLLDEDGLEHPMDFYTFDGFICAVLSGPHTIMPSEWLRWVWDEKRGEQSPEFKSEKQAKRILSLLIGHANVLAFTLVHGPQHYEPCFYSRGIDGKSVPIIDEWCCGYVKGIALDPAGWQPLIDARPDWFEVIHLYGTEAGWERLKQLVEAQPDSAARHQVLLIELPQRRAISMPTGLPGAPRGKDYGHSLSRLILAATTHAPAAPARSSSAATGPPTPRCISRTNSLYHPPLPATFHRPVCGRFNFFDQTATTERRTRISQPDGGSARCRVSRVQDQPSAFCPSTPPLTTPSTSSAT
jgi:uncharacterized protein